jgi:lipopolysaccharide transport system permease protein
MRKMQNFQKHPSVNQPYRFFSQKVIEPPHGLFSLRLHEIWEYRELLFFFVWRDIKVRYKQTVLGVSWAVIHPLITMVIFSIIFGRLAKFSTGDIPYPIFSYAGLLPWQLFSRTISDATSSLISNQNMVTKVYFPRIILPVSTSLSGLVDFAIAMIVFFGLMIYFHIPFSVRLLLLPLLIAVVIVIAMATSLWLSALAVRYRDIKFVTPFLTQIWFYATPVIYPTDMISEQWRWIFNLNPMTAVVEGFRWVLYGQIPSDSPFLFLSICIVILVFITGLIFFQRMEYTFADQL